MAIRFRPAASEVRSLLQKLKLENIERGLSLTSSSIDKKFEHTSMVQQQQQQPMFKNQAGRIDNSETNFRYNYSFQPATVPTSLQSDDLSCFRPAKDLGQFLDQCSQQLQDLPSSLKRRWRRASEGFSEMDFISGNREEVTNGESIRVLQWNVLSQTLGTKNDNFDHCPTKALEWRMRRFRMLEEIARHDPDIVCLQEVDHFPFLQNALSNLGYSGHFKPKPDSPCLHLSGNTGPDGCAIFYKTDKFELKKLESRVLEIWGVPSNQVAMSLMLETRSTGSQLVVSTTHLKARKGPLLSALRNEQARDLLDHLTRFADGKPVICTGDFNAEPDEPVYTTMTHPDELGLSSAYASVHGGKEYDYTSWKIRGEEECKEILDYIFYSEQGFQVEAVLEPVAEDEIGIDRLPNLAFASDHLSLVTDLKILVPEINIQNF